MNTINVRVTNKIATASARVTIVCGNSDYQIKFTFDREWDEHVTKTARFIWNGQFKDVAFNGDTCPVPILKDTTSLKVGVYAGELTTTTPATIDCERSILCGGEKMQDEPGNGEAQVDAVRDAGVQALSDIETAKDAAIAEIEDKIADLEDAVIGGGTIPTSIDLSGYESPGQIVETYADGTTKTTTVEFDESGNPIKITDGDGNVTTLTW